MFKRFLLLTSGLLVVLSGLTSRVQGDQSHGAKASADVVVAERSIEDRTLSDDAFGGNQEQ